MSATLRNLALLALTLFGSSALPAIAGDLFNVVLRVADGSVEDHSQNMTSAQCEAALETFRKARAAGQQYTLTLEEPPRVTGVVLEMNCIGPDGSIRFAPEMLSDDHDTSQQ